jgi:hypothetical protein
MFVGLAVGAGLLLFVLRRLFAPKPTPVEEISDNMTSLFSGDSLLAGRDLLSEKILPEAKPVLRALLREIEASVSQGFKRAERAIDDL